MDRLTEWFINQAEKLGDDEEGLTVTFVRREGNSALYECSSESDDVWRGWWYDGEGIADIRWYSEPVDGWPESLAN